MQLFAANCTPQGFKFNYRVPESDRSLSTDIPSGENRKIGDDKYNAHQVQSIVESSQVYGMYMWRDLERVPDGIMISLLFSKDEPVPPAVIRDVMDRNRKDLTMEGAQRRRDLAVAAARVVNQTDASAANRASVGIEEDQPGTISMESGTKLAEGYAGPDSRVAKESSLSERREQQRPQRPTRRR